MPLRKAWQTYDPAEARRLTAALGVYELGDLAGNVLYIGFAGGRAPFGLRGEITAHFDPTTPRGGLPGLAAYRYEVNQMYLSRFIELLDQQVDAAGVLPPGNLRPGEYLPGGIEHRLRRLAGPQEGA